MMHSSRDACSITPQTSCTARLRSHARGVNVHHSSMCITVRQQTPHSRSTSSHCRRIFLFTALPSSLHPALQGHLESLELLLNKAPQPTAHQAADMLSAAVQRPQRVPVLAFLLQRGANMLMPTTPERGGRTPLNKVFAEEKPCPSNVEALIRFLAWNGRMDALVTLPDATQWCPLDVACQKVNLTVMFPLELQDTLQYQPAVGCTLSFA